MIRYCLTSTKFEGKVLYTFGSDGRLEAFQITGVLTDEQHAWLVSYTPVNLQEMETFRLKYKLNVTEVPIEVSFDVFWETYSYKVDKVQTIKEWNKLQEADQATAIVKIKAFRAFCAKKGQNLPYPCRYLKNRRFEDAV